MKNSFLILLCLFISCVTQKTKKVIPFDYAIIQYDSKTRHLFKDSVPTTLSPEEILLSESIVGKQIQEIIDKNNPNKRNRKYVRQYIAVQNSDGEKELFIQCLSNGIALYVPEWKHSLINIADGGASIIRVNVNLSKKTYNDLSTGMEG